MPAVPARAADIRLAVFDVDGVLTDGGLLLGPTGEEYKVFHVHDGLGLVMLRESGLKVAVISSRSAPVVAERMAALGIEHVFQGRDDKRAALLDLAERLGVSPAAIAYTGDDLVDLPAMAAAGLSIAVADAHPRVRESAHWVTQKPGGRGAAREVCEMLLEAQGLLQARFARYVGA
jgi:3-deoxy-D-manno-octulosonate 8-phosphate phosphatase (KDO 8-P phosphatase)